MGHIPSESALGVAAGTAVFATVKGQGTRFQGDSSHRMQILEVVVVAASTCDCHEVRSQTYQTSGDWMDALVVPASWIAAYSFLVTCSCVLENGDCSREGSQSRLGRDSKDTDTTSQGLEGLLEPK